MSSSTKRETIERGHALFGFEPRFAVKRLLVGAVGVGVFERGAQDARVHQGVGEGFGGTFVGKDLDVAHGRVSEVGGIEKETGTKGVPVSEV